MPNSFCSTGEGLLVTTNGIDPVYVWRGDAATLELAGLIAPTTAVQGAGAGVGTLNGTYFAYVSYIREDGFESSLSPISGDFILTNANQVNYTSVPVSPDARTVARRIWRNTNGQARTIYLDVTIEDNVSTTASSILSDTILQANLNFALLDSANFPHAHDNDPPPDTKPYVFYCLNLAFYLGYENYAEGSCEVVTGSPLVQGRGTEWRSNWVGRNFYPAGGNAVYEIESVDVTNQIITLTGAFLGLSNLFCGYAVRPTPTECAAMYWSQPGKPEAVNPLNAVAVPDEDDVVTGGMVMFGFGYVLKRKSIYRFTFNRNPAKDGRLYPSCRRGAVNERCAVVVGDVAYILDERGIYRFTDGQDGQDVSGPIQDIFRDGTDTPINWQAARYFHASHSPSEFTIRWFVNFSGDYQPRTAICFCYALDRWWTEEYHRPIGCSVLGQSGRSSATFGRNVERVYYGSDAGQIYALTQAAPDVADAAANTLVLDAGISTVTINAAASADLVGAPVVHRAILSSDLQTRRVTAVSGQVITVHPPWLRRPVEGDEIVLGGFPYTMRTDFYRLIRSEKTDERNVEVFFKRNPESKLDVSIAFDQGNDDEEAAISLTAESHFGVETKKGRDSARINMGKREGFALMRYDGLREGSQDGRRDVSIELTGIGGNGVDSIQSLIVKGGAS